MLLFRTTKIIVLFSKNQDFAHVLQAISFYTKIDVVAWSVTGFYIHGVRLGQLVIILA
jgi:hypothetical protein